MALHVFLIFFLCCFFLCQNSVVGDSWKLSKEEDLELERQLQLLNKPPIKTIHTDDGTIYDCIDFYQQPAFDHPLLKNHNYSFEIEAALNEAEDREGSDLGLDFGLKGEECPRGTVIIKRLSKEDLIRAKIASNKRASANSNIHYAIARTKNGPKRYAGAGGRIAIYEPYVNGRQYSAARVVIENGLFDRIAVGWRVDPNLHDDKKSHFYIRTDVGVPGGPTHCFDTQCPGFVVTSTKYPLGGQFARISVKGGPRYVLQVDILRNENGDWRLRVGDYDKIQVGFWPKNIFSETTEGLRDLANYIDWGGEVLVTPEEPRPQMGIGSFPTNDTHVTSYISRVTYRNQHSQKLYARGLEPYADIPEEYKVVDVPFSRSEFKHIILYGGPGGPS